jgi:hypothetical protein
MEGNLYAWAETGSEGYHWAFEEIPFRGYEGLHILKNNDYLTVYNEDGSIKWRGVIDLEFKTGFEHFAHNPSCGQQTVFGYWVHGNQKGMKIKDWAAMFFNNPPLKAKLEYIKTKLE